MNSLPDFIVVGAAKSGTTSLYKFLNSDPRVFIPEIKECRFFSQMPTDFKGGAAARFQNEGPRELKDYLDLFRNKENYLKGDISNDYFYYFERSIVNIQEVYRNEGKEYPKIIITLRNPIDRVYSMYGHIIRMSSDSENFHRAFQLSKERLAAGYAWMFDLMGVGESADAVESYLSAFPCVKVYLFEEIFTSAGLLNLCNFLGIEVKHKDLKAVKENANDYMFPRNILVTRLRGLVSEFGARVPGLNTNKGVRNIILPLIDILSNANKGKSVRLSKSQEKYLSIYYEDDINRLERLLNKDLSLWRR